MPRYYIIFRGGSLTDRHSVSRLCEIEFGTKSARSIYTRELNRDSHVATAIKVNNDLVSLCFPTTLQLVSFPVFFFPFRPVNDSIHA